MKGSLRSKYYTYSYKGREYVKQPPKKLLGIPKNGGDEVIFESYTLAASILNTTKNAISASMSRGTSLKGYFLERIK